ncbi:MAG: tyrosine-type recombinase/integrase [Desulfovibrio sp.]|nr:tyrosine-type recombinase/integrase [Desulfovibrio sp.]
MQLTPISSLGTTPKNPHVVSSCRSKRLARSERMGYTPSYLYLRGSLYYFRYAFSDVEKAEIGRSEIRISLRTGYRREAQPLASALYTEIQHLMKDSMLDYMEIRRRMNEVLCRLLEQDSRDTSPRVNYEIEGMEPITPVGVANAYAMMNQFSINSPEFRENHGSRIMIELIRSGVVDLQEVTPENIHVIINEYIKIQQTYQKVIQHRLEGDHSFEAPIFAERAANQQAQKSIVVQEVEAEAKPNTPVSEFIRKYVQTKIKDGNWRVNGVETHENRLTSLLDILGDVDIHSITREDMREVRDTLRKLPPNRQRSKEYKGKKIDELLEMNPDKVLSVKTVNMTLEAISSLFEWGIREGELSTNPAKGLQLKDTRQAITLRDPFSLEDIQAIFSSPYFIEDKYNNAGYFWIPLIALYSGMRLEEIAQLYLEDIYQDDDGVWVFDINDNLDRTGKPDKQVKNINAKRLVPLHHDLIKIGLLKYYDRMSSIGESRLFPMLNKTEKVKKYGKQPGKKIGDLVKSLGLTGKKSFHSFRHTFSDYFKQRGEHTDVFRQVYGHDIPELAGKQYGSKFPPQKCLDEVVSKLNFNLNFGQLRKSKHALGHDE